MNFGSRIPLAAWFGLTVSLYAQDKPIAFTGAQIIPIAGEPIPNGVLVVHAALRMTIQRHPRF